MPHLCIGMSAMTTADGDGAFERGVNAMQEPRRRGNRKRARHRSGTLALGTVMRFTLFGYSDHDDQSGDRADENPQPLLLGQAGSLQLIQILRELMQILLIELRQTLVHLLLREA